MAESENEQLVPAPQPRAELAPEFQRRRRDYVERRVAFSDAPELLSNGWAEVSTTKTGLG